ncbi:hypothetical protein TNCV_222211 [Trichonephila clavipes]|nr:hypothetical protein TNCV_222211 [Trichonephila clavipes]
MRSTKELIEKDVLMPVKYNVFLWNLPDVEEMPSHDGETVQFSSGLDGKGNRCGLRTVRLAGYGIQAKSRSHHLATQSSRAGAAK